MKGGGYKDIGSDNGNSADCAANTGCKGINGTKCKGVIMGAAVGCATLLIVYCVVASTYMLVVYSTVKYPCVESVHDHSFAFRLHPGDDLYSSLNAFVSDHAIDAGYIVTCVGSLTVASIRFANNENYTTLQGPFEIVSLTGTLSTSGGSHIHISISAGNGTTVGGHLGEGSLVYTTAEIVIGDATSLKFIRTIDPETTYYELDVVCK
ncbi:DNA-binding protein [Pelomyxa schiedti]|nr:DNA-binding protein [Pelomyxa schiedti]